MSTNTCAVVCMSTSSLDDVGQKSPLIHTLRLNIHTNQGIFLDGQSMRSADFYRHLISHPEDQPTTSPPDFNQIAEHFLELARQGYTDAIVPTLASALSQTSHIINEVSALVRHQINVHVIETGTIGILEGVFSLEAARLLESGATPLQVMARLRKLKNELHLFFEVDSLKYLIRNGRISKISGIMGTLMRLKPIIHLHNGQMNVIARVRTTNHALEYLAKHVAHTSAGKYTKLFGLYTSERALYDALEQQVRKHMDVTTIHAYPMTPVVGAHIGPSATGIGMWIRPDEENKA